MHRSVHKLIPTAIIVASSLALTTPAPPASAGTVVYFDHIITKVVADPVRSEFYLGMTTYYSDPTDDDVIRIGSNGTITGAIVESNLSNPVEIAVAPDGSELYVHYDQNSDILAYSLRSLEPAGRVELPAWFYLRNMLVTGTRIYATGIGGLAIIDRSTFAVIYLGRPPGVVGTGIMAISPDETRLLISGGPRNGYSMVMVDITTDSPIRVGHDCRDFNRGNVNIIYSPDGSRLYINQEENEDYPENGVQIYAARQDGLMVKTHGIQVWGDGMALSSNGQALFTLGKETDYGRTAITKTNTQTLLPYRVVELQSELPRYYYNGMALSFDDHIIAVPVLAGSPRRTTALELVNVSHEAPNRAGWSVRALDSITNEPFKGVYTISTVEHETFVDIKAGIYAMVSLPEGPWFYEVLGNHHLPGTFVYPDKVNGQWDHVGEVTLDRTPGHLLEDAREICIEEPLVPGPNSLITMHGLNFRSDVELLQLTGDPGDPIEFGAYGQQNWATIGAVVTLTPDHPLGFYRDNFHVSHPGGDIWAGQYFVKHPDYARLGFTTFVVEVLEDAGTAELTVNRFHNSTGAVSIDYETGDAYDTADPGVDYTHTTGTLTWADGDDTPKFISVPIIDDAPTEAPEIFSVFLHDPSPGAVASGVRAEVRIIDNRASDVGLTLSAVTVDETVGTVSLEVTRTGYLGAAGYIDWATDSGTATPGGDYTQASGTLGWAVGEGDPQYIVIDILDDALIEGDEQFTVELSDPSGNAFIGDIEKTLITIIDDEVMEVALSAATYDADEGDGAVTVTAHRTGATNGIVTVSYATTDGTAIAGTDYTAAAGIMTWADGDGDPKTFSIFVTDDTDIETTENLSIELSNTTGGAALIDPSFAVLTIEDNDGTEITLDQAAFVAIEGGAGIGVVVHRTGSDNGLPASVDYSTVDDTATAGLDYVPVSGTLTWFGGDTTDKNFNVAVLDDALLEGWEVVNIVLTNPTGDAALGDPAAATLSIEDDEWVETAINTETSQPQTRPDLAIAADGSSVVVWESYLQDGAGWGVFGQRFDPSGTPAGTEFQVNSTTAGDQRFAAVAMQSGGSFTVVWSDADASGGGVHGRRFNKSGAPLGASFIINTTTTDNQSEPDIAMDGTGAALVVWQSNHTGDLDIRGRAFTAAGSPTGNDFAINTTTANDQQLPSVAGSAGGGFVTVWQSIGQDGPTNSGIIARRLASNGAPVGVEVIVNEWTSGDQIAPDVGVTSTGAFLVAWQDTTHRDGMGSSIRARRFSPTAAPLSGDIQLNTYWLDDQMRPKVACDGPGLVQVAWESTDQDSSSLGIYSRTIGNDGLFVSPEIRFNTFVIGIQHRPAVARSDSGAYWAAWASGGQDGSGDGIFGIFGAAPVITELFSDGFESGGTTAWSSSSQ